MENDGISKERDLKNRVNHNIDKIQEAFDLVFSKRQLTVERFMVKPKGIKNE